MTVGLFLLSAGHFLAVWGGEFIPQLQEGDFAFHCILPQGHFPKTEFGNFYASLSLIREFDEVKMVIGKTGSAEVPTDPMPLETTDLIIVLKPQDEWKSGRSYDEIGRGYHFSDLRTFLGSSLRKTNLYKCASTN